ncbi:hypothetical protein BH09ACT7_BH09ACT7_35370 [soil metagenome]
METAIVSGTEAQVATLRERAGLTVVSGRPEPAGRWSVVAYLDDGVRADLVAEGMQVSVVADAQTTESRWAVGPGGAAGQVRVKGEFSAELLSAALEFVRERLNAFATDALSSANALAAKLGAPGSGATISADRDSALGSIDNFFAMVEVGLRHPTAELIRSALVPLATTIGTLEGAATKLGKPVEQLLGPALSAEVAGGGILSQLGLPAGPGSIKASGGLLGYSVHVDAPNIVGVGADSVELAAGLRYSGGPPALGLTVTVTGARIAIPGAGELLAAIGIAGSGVSADIAITVDSASGVTIGGASQGRIALPARAQIGPVKVKGLALDFARDGQRLIFDLVALVEGNIGPPLRLTVDGAGLRLVVDPSQAAPLQQAIPKMPTGFGVVIDAGPVHGGGYLEIRSVPGHPDWTRYGGALQLRIGPVDVKAFGVITDRPGRFSFVVVMSVELYPPIELGLLFTLNGIGGIVGVEVAADTEALRAGLRTGALAQLLFPSDPVGEAPSILDTLSAVFPPQSGGFVVGPMVKLGWGRPISFVTAELALILSLPDTKVLLLGRLRLAIPLPELALIDLRAEVYGEFSADRILVIASLAGSRIGFFSIGGDIGLLLRFGDDPTFVLSAGGFHPRYDPPAELASLERLNADLSAPGQQLRIEAYVAITTNSVQFGGRLHLAYAIGDTGVFGYVGLDALIRFAPRFGFMVDVEAGVAVRVFGLSIAAVNLHLHLEGPGPWKAWGTGELCLPWPLPDVSLDVGPITWGEDAATTPALVSPRRLVLEALTAAPAWRAAAAPGREPPVKLREVSPGPADGLLVEPWSLLQGVQSAVPLDTDISRVGASPVVAGEQRISLGEPAFEDADGGEAVTGAARSPVSDRFAPGQYLDLSDDQQLRRPSFEQFPAGIRIDPQGVGEPVAEAIQADLMYETSFPHRGPRIRGIFGEFFTLATADKALVLGAGAPGHSELRGADRYSAVSTPLLMAGPEQVVIRGRSDLAPVAGLPGESMTWTHAENATARHPELFGTVQVVALGGA